VTSIVVDEITLTHVRLGCGWDVVRKPKYFSRITPSGNQEVLGLARIHDPDAAYPPRLEIVPTPIRPACRSRVIINQRT